MPRKITTRGRLGSDIYAKAHLLPDEDPKAFLALRDGLFEELEPRTALERILAQNIVDIVWEIERHRRLLAATLKTAFFEQAEGVYVDGKPGKPSAVFYTSDSRGRFIDQLRSTDDGKRAKAEEILESKGVTKAEISAAAFISRESPVAYHEQRIADLERRRRHLMNEYELLQAKRKAREPVSIVPLAQIASG
mgnify:CR=1 FL=1